MGFVEGQVVRLSDSPTVQELVRGRLGLVKEVIESDEGTSYLVAVSMLLMPVRERDLREGDPEAIIH